MKVINYQPFGRNIYVSTSFEEAKKYIQRMFDFDISSDYIKGSSGQCLNEELPDGASLNIIILPEVYEEDTLYHECLHCCWDVIGDVGIKLTSKNHELLTYSQGWLASQIKKKIYGIK